MTHRERPASGAVPAAARPPAGRAAPRESAEAVPPRPPLWEELYPNLTPAQQTEMLTLARRQGVVYAPQLPPPNAGNGSDRARLFLGRLFATRPADLEPVRPGPVEWVDGDLDAAQRAAVARALATPDVCLVQGLPGTGKSRVVAEIVTQAARRGERVLLLAAAAPAIDRVLEQVGTRDAVCPVRCVGRDERPEALPPAARALTFAERVRQVGEQALEGSRRQITAAEERCRRRRADEPRLARCTELAEANAQLEAQAAALRRKQDEVPGEVERAAEAGTAGACSEAIAECDRARREALEHLAAARATLDGRRAEQVRERDALAPQIEELRPLAEAKQQGRWWTGSWWRATFAGNAATRLAELEARRAAIEKTLAALDEEASKIDADREQAEQTFRADWQRHLDAEVARRRAALDEQAEAVKRDRALLDEKWQLVLRELDADTPHPAGPTPEAAQAARHAWQNRLDEDERHAVFAREWADGLAALRDSLPQRLAAHANLVAATTTALPFDEHFGDASGVTFDLLVLEQAHLLTESEFVQAARRARRWVLVGEPELEGDRETRGQGDKETGRQGENDAGPRRRVVVRPRVVAAPRLFVRLWQHLHCDPSRLPYTWFQEGPRLGCRLRPVADDQRQYLESEPVVDFPDIELRILARPRTEPVLAEVLFPAAMALPQAKEFIFKELQELPVRARGRALVWTESHDRLLLQLSDGDDGATVAVPLEAGVRELVAGDAPAGADGWHTRGLEFDRAAGWQRPRAEEWVEQHLGLRDLGRTARLDTPHRPRPDLAAFLSDLLFANAYCVRAAAYTNGRAAPVEFVAVPPAAPESGKPDHRRGNGTPRPRPPRGGAGLELDLADPRHRDRLPSELRPELPADGLVNYLEAQAVVRALERLAADRPAGARPSVGIVALYPAQAELIRCLLRRNAALAEALDLCVDVPAAFRERECGVLLLSLTRSHSHRAVTFGEGPHALALALTRARDRVVLFGDPGTLARRGQWEGPVDHLDEAAAARERDLVCRLLRYLQGEGAHPRVFHVHESARA